MSSSKEQGIQERRERNGNVPQKEDSSRYHPRLDPKGENSQKRNFQKTALARYWSKHSPFRQFEDREWEKWETEQKEKRAERIIKRQEFLGKLWSESAKRLQELQELQEFPYNFVLFAGGVAWKSPYLKKDTNVPYVARGGLVLVLSAVQASIIAWVVAYLTHSVGVAVFAWVAMFYFVFSLEQSIQSRHRRSKGVIAARILPAIFINLVAAFFTPVLFSQGGIKEEAIKKVDARLASLDRELKSLENKRFLIDGEALKKGEKRVYEDVSSTKRADTIRKELNELTGERSRILQGEISSRSLSFDKQLEYAWKKSFPSRLEERLAAEYENHQVARLKNTQSVKPLTSAETGYYSAIHETVEGKYTHRLYHVAWFMFFLALEAAPLLLWAADDKEKDSYRRMQEQNEERRIRDDHGLSGFNHEDFQELKTKASQMPDRIRYEQQIAEGEAQIQEIQSGNFRRQNVSSGNPQPTESYTAVSSPSVNPQVSDAVGDNFASESQQSSQGNQKAESSSANNTSSESSPEPVNLDPVAGIGEVMQQRWEYHKRKHQQSDDNPWDTPSSNA